MCGCVVFFFVAIAALVCSEAIWAYYNGFLIHRWEHLNVYFTSRLKSISYRLLTADFTTGNFFGAKIMLYHSPFSLP